jgi:hypothetical protein
MVTRRPSNVHILYQRELVTKPVLQIKEEGESDSNQKILNAIVKSLLEHRPLFMKEETEEDFIKKVAIILDAEKERSEIVSPLIFRVREWINRSDTQSSDLSFHILVLFISLVVKEGEKEVLEDMLSFEDEIVNPFLKKHLKKGCSRIRAKKGRNEEKLARQKEEIINYLLDQRRKEKDI